MKVRRATSDATFCTFCAHGRHTRCVGPCECAERAHDPEVRVAAVMRSYVRPDRAGLPPEELATEWRRATGAVR